MENYIYSAVEFQRNKLKQLYSSKKTTKDKFIDPKLIDIEMDTLRKLSFELTGSNYKEYYKTISKASQQYDNYRNNIEKSLVRKSYSGVKFIDNTETIAIIEYKPTSKWITAISLVNTTWNDFDNEKIISMIKKFIHYFHISIIEHHDRKTVLIDEEEDSKIYACEDLLIPLSKLVRALAEASILLE